MNKKKIKPQVVEVKTFTTSIIISKELHKLLSKAIPSIYLSVHEP